MTIDFSKVVSIFTSNFPLFLYGVGITLIFAIVGTIFGLLIGLVVGGIRALDESEYDNILVIILKKIGKIITGLYIWIFRGTPMMVQAMFIYYVLKPTLDWTPLVAGLVIISINTGAYMAEIIRAGIQSVDKGQTEAAQSIGMNAFQTLIYIIFPQAIKNTFPSIGNQLIVNIKDSSMMNVIGVTELFFQTRSIAGSNYRYVETFIVAGAIYLFLTTISTYILNYIEKNMEARTKSKNKDSYKDFCS